MSFSFNNRVVRAFVAVGVVGALVAGAEIAQADPGDPNWNITLSGSATPTFPLGQVDLKLHVADDSSNPASSGQVAIMENNRLLAAEDLSANGDVEFPSSDFADPSYSYLGIGTHNLVAHYSDNTTLPFAITVGRGQVKTSFSSVTTNSSNSTATFNWNLAELGNIPYPTFPTATVSLIEDGDTSSPLNVQVTPSFTQGATSVSGSFNNISIEPGTHYYQAYFRGDNNFSANTSSPWSQAPFVNTAITWSTLQPGQDNWTVGDTQVSATITPDQFVSQVTGSAELSDNGIQVATTQVTSGTDLIFNYAPAAGAHSFTIHYDATAPFLATDSAVEARTYIDDNTTTTTSTTLPPDTTTTTIPDTTTTTLPVTTTTTAPGSTTTTTSTSIPTTTTTTIPVTGSSTPVRTQPQGYRLVAKDGTVTSFGVTGYGDMSGHALNSPIIAAIDTADDNGYWLLGADGGIFSFGDAAFYGSTGSMHLNAPIVGMAPTADGKGYWLVASDGGVFNFGDAAFFGSMGGSHLNKPIVGITASPDGLGYRLVASDGGIFSYGTSQFYGSMGGAHLNAPIVGMAPTSDGKGYWMVASDGGIFSFGDATFKGSAGATKLNKPIVGMLATPDSGGYWFVASDGGVFNYGNAIFAGSAGGSTLSSPIVALA